MAQRPIQTSQTAILDTAQEWTKTQNFNATTLTDAANIAWDASLNQVASVVLQGSRVLDNPTNIVDGATYVLAVKQDGVGSRGLTYGAAYKWPGGTPPTLTTTPNAFDAITFICSDTTRPEVSTITTIADTNGSLSGDYFTLNSPITAYYVWYNVTARIETTDVDFTAETIVGGDYWTISAPGTNYYVWYTVDAAGVDPAPVGTGILVAVLTTDTAAQRATKTQLVLEAHADFTAIVNTNVVTVSTVAVGSVVDAADFNAGVAATVTQQGISTSVDPAPGGTGISVTVGGSASANTVASATQAVLEAHADFTASVSTNVVKVTNIAVGNVTNIAAGTSGFTTAVITPGVDAANGKNMYGVTQLNFS